MLEEKNSTKERSLHSYHVKNKNDHKIYDITDKINLLKKKMVVWIMNFDRILIRMYVEVQIWGMFFVLQCFVLEWGIRSHI